MRSAADGRGKSDTATVTIVVSANSAPVGVSDSYSGPAGISFDAAGGVLVNETDPNNGTPNQGSDGSDHDVDSSGYSGFFSVSGYTYLALDASAYAV